MTDLTTSTDRAASLLAGAGFEAAAAGGKAATLHTLATAGFRVPPGFVIGADLDLETVSDEDLARLVGAIGGFRVAVRSSAVLEDLDEASFAGQYETFLDVADLATLRRRISECRDSGGNERVRSYMANRGLDPDAASVAVLVQRQIAARTAGVGFTIDPVTGIEDHAVIECCRGLGDRLVSGRVRPTRLVVRLADGAVVERAGGEEDVELSDDEVRELAGLLLAVQAHRHRPQDVEWAVDEDGRVWLLQSRPVTTIGWRKDVDQFSDADLRDGGVSARVCTPLMFSLYDHALQPTMQAYFEELKLLGPDSVPDWLATFYGRVYWNASAVKRCLARVPGYDEERFDRDLGVQKDYGSAGPGRTPTNVVTVARAVPVALALEKLYRRQLETVEAFAAAWPETHEAWRARAARVSQTDDQVFVEELADCLLSFHTTTERTYFTTFYNNANIQTDFKKMLDKLDAATGGTTSVIDLIGGLADISHMAMQRGVVELYRVAARDGFDSPSWHDALHRFIDRHGFHADRELDLTCPRWSEDPDRVRSMVAAMLETGTAPADPDAGVEAQRQRFAAELAAVRRRVRARPTTRARFGRALDRHVDRVRTYLVARERMREFSSQCYAIVRAYVLEAGVRLAAAGRLADPAGVFMLSVHELVDLAQARVAGEDLEQTILFRRAMYDGYRDVNPPHELGGGVTQAAAGAELAERGGALTGLGCSPGVVEGSARVIMSLDRTGDLRPGDILVTRFTDPGWTPALGLVAGVVTEVGGMLSHGAVIGREYGIPAVLNVQGATSVLRSGQRIRIDGAAGTVELLDRGEQARGNRVEGGTQTGFGRSPRSTAAEDHDDHALQPRAASRMPEGKRFLCVAGGDGSGKTTQVARLAAAFESDGQTVAPVTIWDAFLDPKIASKLPFRKPSEVYGYLAMLDPVSRTHFLFHALHLALDLAAQRDADVVVANAYWYKYFATEVAHGGDPATLRRLTAGFPEPDLTFYLSITPEQSLARKVQRSDYESGYGQGDRDFVDFQQRTHDVLEALSSELGWIALDGDSPVRDVTAAMVERLQAVRP